MKKLDVPQSGSQADTTASRNRFGQYNRTRSMPTQPRTEAQLNARAILSQVSKSWSSLTDENRAAWAAWASAHPITDSLGQSISLTGHMSFVGVNTLNLQAGKTIQSGVPTGVAIDPPALTAAPITIGGLLVKAADPIPVDTIAIIWASPPMSPGRSYNGDFRIVAVVPGSNAAAQTLLAAADLSAKFGTLAANQKFFVAVQLINDGNVSPSANVSFVLSA